MAGATLILPLVSLPLGRSVVRGALAFTTLDAAEQEERHTVEATCQVENLGLRVHVHGDIAGSVQSQCHRCLEPFTRSETARFERVLQRGPRPGAGDEEIVHVADSVQQFDLGPWVREAVILEEPMQLLCAPDCRGLCPQCGTNRNQGSCDCGPQADPRWGPLRDLRLEP